MADYQKGVPIEITDTFYLSGVPTDPTTVVYSILGPDGTVTTYTFPGDPEIAHPGVGEFVLSLSPPSLPGLYQYDVNSTGTVVASRAGSFVVLDDLSSPSDVDWAVPGPCSAWASSQDVWNCCGQPTMTVDGVECAVDFTAEALAASQVLFELSGRRFSGACERTVRPCSSNNWCGIQVLSRGHIVDYNYEMGWRNTYWAVGSAQPCGCSPIDRILLAGYPVREITEVKIDGAVVDADTYRLDERRYLTRVRDPADPDTILMWPTCQALDLPDTEDGTFSVTYRYGMDPPIAAQMAATALACEMYRACASGGGAGGDCALPVGVTRVTRQGVTVEKRAVLSWIYTRNEGKGYQTGLLPVDTFLNAYNPSGLSRRPRTWSPDGLRYARGVGS